MPELAPVQAELTVAQPALSEAQMQENALAATVQIRLAAPLVDDTGQPASLLQYEVADSLGTLVTDGANNWIITHDHWGDFIVSATSVTFSDASGRLLLEMDALTFRNLIRYRDEGTLILNAPIGLTSLTPVFLADTAVYAGDVVMLVRRQGERVDLFTAVVEELEFENGRALLALRSSNGEVIAHGDSGGGVWRG